MADGSNILDEPKMSLSDVAAALGVSDRTVRRLLAAWKIRHLRVGKRIVILRADVDAYLCGAVVVPPRPVRRRRRLAGAPNHLLKSVAYRVALGLENAANAAK